MPVSVLEPSDISSSATDFQADGTAAAGSTGRVADAGHVHPSASIGYEVVSVAVSYADGNVTSAGDVDVTVSAPTGYVVVGGGYSTEEFNNESGWSAYGNQASGGGPAVNAPLTDGSGWRIAGRFLSSSVTATFYAVCLAV